MKAGEIADKIRTAIPDARIQLKDLTGPGDHWHGEVISAAFAGMSLLRRHRLVMTALADEMKGPIHALTLDVKTPDE